MGNRIASYADETGFEQNAGFSKPKKAVSDAVKAAASQATQQAKAIAQDTTAQFLGDLYGPSTPSPDQTGPTSKQSQQQQQGAGSSQLQNVRQQLTKQQGESFGSAQDKQGKQPQSPENQAKQISEQQHLERHKKTYDIEFGMTQARHEREEAEKKRKQEEEEERDRQEQEKQQEAQQLVTPAGKATGASGRNRKGQPPLAVRQSRTKGETGRNVVAG